MQKMGERKNPVSFFPGLESSVKMWYTVEKADKAEEKMELFDIVDENGLPIGETCSRTRAHQEGLRHRTAHIWVIRVEQGTQQVLLQKRAMHKDSFPGRFDTSSAGHIQAGDGPLVSALRELQEELGISAQPEDLQFAGTFRIAYEKEFHGALFRDNEVAFVYVYDRPVKAEELTIQKEELDCVAWFDLEEVCAECAKHNPKFCVPREGLKTLQFFLERKENQQT